jgi:hypothetical protein
MRAFLMSIPDDRRNGVYGLLLGLTTILCCILLWLYLQTTTNRGDVTDLAEAVEALEIVQKRQEQLQALHQRGATGDGVMLLDKEHEQSFRWQNVEAQSMVFQFRYTFPVGDGLQNEKGNFELSCMSPRSSVNPVVAARDVEKMRSKHGSKIAVVYLPENPAINYPADRLDEQLTEYDKRAEDGRAKVDECRLAVARVEEMIWWFFGIPIALGGFFITHGAWSLFQSYRR